MMLLRGGRRFACGLCGVKEPRRGGERLRDVGPDQGRKERVAMGEARAFWGVEQGERGCSAGGGEVHGTGVVHHRQSGQS